MAFDKIQHEASFHPKDGHRHGVLFLVSLTNYKVSLHIRSALACTGFSSNIATAMQQADGVTAGIFIVDVQQ